MDLRIRVQGLRWFEDSPDAGLNDAALTCGQTIRGRNADPTFSATRYTA